MLVSMTPNEEVKTIHASLNDGKLRKWEFEPYIEQGKIELTDQDYATIQSIKGNTVKFNQLVGTPTPINTLNGTTFSLKGDGGIDVSGTGTANHFCEYRTVENPDFFLILTHKYYWRFRGIKSGMFGQIFFSATGQTSRYVVNATEDGSGIFTFQDSIFTTHTIRFYTTNTFSGNTTVYMELIDLTQIFGLGSEPETPEDFETWLSNNIGLLPYYDHTPGTLIPFKGSGLKTTGKNLFETAPATNPSTSSGITYTVADGVVNINGTPTGTSVFQVATHHELPLIAGKDYIISCDNTRMTVDFFGTNSEGDSGWTNIATSFVGSRTFTLTSTYKYYRYNIRTGAGALPFNNEKAHCMIRLTDVSDDTFEPYKESTLSLETLNTLFPTGMKEAGTVYDEISDKAYTRVGSVDLGTLNWRLEIESYIPDGTCFLLQPVPTNLNIKMASSNSVAINGESAIYKIVPQNELAGESATTGDMRLAVGTGVIRIVNKKYSTVEDFKTAMSGVMLYYELATPTSQDISLDLTYPIWDNGTEQILPINGSTPTTSPMVATIEYPDRTEDVDFLYKQTTFESAIPQFSLVCKNQELPMNLEDGKLICECDSSITNESGFFDCKVKMQDLDSVAYSQKIQLHVERGIND